MRLRHLFALTSALLLLAVAQPAAAQRGSEILDNFQETHPLARIGGAQFSPHEGELDEAKTMTTVYGTTLATGNTPVRSARNLLNILQPALGNETGRLVPIVQPSGTVIQGAMTDPTTGQAKFSVMRFGQTIGGVPVFRAGVGVVVRNEANNPVVYSSFDVKELDGFSVGVNANAVAVVTGEMKASVLARFDAEPVMRSVLGKREDMRLTTGDGSYVVYAGFQTTQAPELAVQFVATRGTHLTYPDYQKELVVASVETGEVLYAESLISGLTDVNGTVSGRATDGIGSLECHPEVPFGMPYGSVSIGGTEVFADSNGDFTIPNGGTAPVTVVSRLRGQYFDLFDEGNGGSTPQISQTVTPPGPADFMHNPTNGNEFSAANVNCYLESNLCRDYVLSFEPAFPVIDNQTGFQINTNINSSCNAFYDGQSINFYRAGGGCNNTGFSDVVYHEYGHHLINVSGNGQGQMGEGSGDCVGVLMQDEPELGTGFFGNCGSGLRNADNNHQYPCTGAIHDCGMLLSGCIWDLRNELIVTEPSQYRNIGSSLFFGMLIMRGQMEPGASTITPDITIYYLTLDDDDTEIGNGTPHYTEIATAFGSHNMDAPPLDLVGFFYPDGRPDFISPNGGVAFDVEITPISDDPIPASAKMFVNDGSGFTQYSLTAIGSNTYEASFPAIPCGTLIDYYLSVDTVGGSTVTSPADAPTATHQTRSGSGDIEIISDEDFESVTGWSVSGDATDGHWEVGVPAGGGDRGDPANDGDGSGRCYLTDNVDGNSDVDDGATILTSPVFDASMANVDAWVSYLRWYSNTAGASPNADVFTVELSNNGGSSWTTVEVVGPAGPEANGGWTRHAVRISDFMTATSNMRIRFTAEDAGAGSVIEAGIDSFRVETMDCGGIAPPQNPDSYLVTKGTELSGGLAAVAGSDNVRLVVERQQSGFRGTKIDVRFDTAWSDPNPIALEVELEMKCSRPGVSQIVDMYNWSTAEYDEIDVRVSSSTGDTSIVLPVDVTKYVQSGTGNVRIQVSWKQGRRPIPQSQAWTGEIDLIIFREP